MSSLKLETDSAAPTVYQSRSHHTACCDRTRCLHREPDRHGDSCDPQERVDDEVPRPEVGLDAELCTDVDGSVSVTHDTKSITLGSQPDLLELKEVA